MTDGNGKQMASFDGLAGLPPSQAVWRSDLYRVLNDHAAATGVVTEYGKRLVAVDERPDGVTARFADGSTASGDVLIGTDGTRSVVRSLIDPAAPGPEPVPLLNFGAVSDFRLDAEPGDMYFAFGKRGFLGYWAQSDGRTAWFSNLPHAEPTTAAQARQVSQEEWLRRLTDVYADDKPGADLLRHTESANLFVLGSTEIMPKVPHWHRGRLVLVGDSVHAPSPSSGQGASLAAESAVELALCLRDLPDVPSAFAAYERLRRTRVEKVAARAAKTNNTKALGPVGKAVMRVLMPVMMNAFGGLEKQLGAEQRYQIKWHETVS
jgi:2-polyprenyl-6-methoxyphenol hydroxylase-like FAD-dependent oxidoreductase